MAGESGTCGFCGTGEGWLGEQGDESTQYLHSAVRTGEPGDWKYERHPNAVPDYGEEEKGPGQHIIWCGGCVGGLAHKYQRFDDTNLHALFISYKVRLELDGLRWTHWEERSEEFRRAHPPDDTAIHMDKLRVEREITDMQNEKFRRVGFDLTSREWRS